MISAPSERKALGQIVETAELADIEAMGLALVIPTTPALLDMPAQVGEQFMDFERGGDDEVGHDAEWVNEDCDEKGEASADAEPSLASPEGQLDQPNWVRGNENRPPGGAASPARSAGPFLRWALAYVRMVVTD